ncbi:MAG: orotate phosphoribosyltransferase [Candidatus Omnitrophica bacterium]|nr:orotate phosphoribosyltransferase [Candidatus Omnitrophota bacterium]
MNTEQVMKIFQQNAALLSGHFLLSGGLHSEQYLQCARVLENPQISEQLARSLSAKFQDQRINTVIGPATGGIILAYELARAWGARALFAERENGQMGLRRGFSLSPRDRVVVAEDVITTGGSVKEVIELVQARGAQLIGVAALVDRSAADIDFGVRCATLLKLKIQNFTPENCPLCRQGIKLVKPGSRDPDAK